MNTTQERDPRNQVKVDLEFLKEQTPYRSWLEFFLETVKRHPEADSQTVMSVPANKFTKYGTIRLNEIAFNALKELMSSIPTYTEVNHLEGQLLSKFLHPDDLVKGTLKKLWKLAELASHER